MSLTEQLKAELEELMKKYPTLRLEVQHTIQIIETPSKLEQVAQQAVANATAQEA